MKRIWILINIIMILFIFSGCTQMPESDFSRSDLMINKKTEIVNEEKAVEVTPDENSTSGKKITILGAQGWLPYVFAAEEGQVPEGAGFDIFERALEGTGYTMEVQPVVGWSRLLELAKMSQIDVVAGIYYNDERAEVYEFSEPFAQDRTVLWVKAGKEFDFNNLSDLDGKIAVLPSGGSYGDDFEAQKEKMTVKSVEGKDQAFELLLSDLGDFYVSSYTDMKASIIKNGYEDKIVALPKAIAENDVYFVMALDNPNVSVMNQLNENIKAMKDSGEIEQLLLEALMK